MKVFKISPNRDARRPPRRKNIKIFLILITGSCVDHRRTLNKIAYFHQEKFPTYPPSSSVFLTLDLAHTTEDHLALNLPQHIAFELLDPVRPDRIDPAPIYRTDYPDSTVQIDAIVGRWRRAGVNGPRAYDLTGVTLPSVTQQVWAWPLFEARVHPKNEGRPIEASAPNELDQLQVVGGLGRLVRSYGSHRFTESSSSIPAFIMFVVAFISGCT